MTNVFWEFIFCLSKGTKATDDKVKNTDRRSGKCLRYKTRAETWQKCLYHEMKRHSPCEFWAEIRRTLVFSSLHMLTLLKGFLRVCEEIFNSTLIGRINLEKTINSSAQWRQTACFHSAGSHVWLQNKSPAAAEK